MNLKEKIKSVGFWSGLIGTLFLVLSAFGVDIGDQTVNAVVNSVCSLLVMFGIISSPADAEEKEGGENGENAAGAASEEQADKKIQ